MPYVCIRETTIHNNWEAILLDLDNPRPDIKSPDEWIALAKTGQLKICGATVVIQNELPFTAEHKK